MTLYDALQHGRHGNPSQRRWWGLKGALRAGRRSEQEQRQKHVRMNYRLVCSSCRYGCTRKISETLDHFANLTDESDSPLATNLSNGTIA